MYLFAYKYQYADEGSTFCELLGFGWLVNDKFDIALGLYLNAATTV